MFVAFISDYKSIYKVENYGYKGLLDGKATKSRFCWRVAWFLLLPLLSYRKRF